MMFFFAINVIVMPLVNIKQRKAIQRPWFPSFGVKRYHAGMKTNIVEIIMVFLIAFDAVAPIYMPSQMKAANVITGMTVM